VLFFFIHFPKLQEQVDDIYRNSEPIKKMKMIKTYLKNGDMSKENQKMTIKDTGRYDRALERLKTVTMDDDLREVCEKALTTALLLTNGLYDENSLKNQQVTDDQEGLRQLCGEKKGKNELDVEVKPDSGDPRLRKAPDRWHLLGMLGVLGVIAGIAGWFQFTDNGTVEGRLYRGVMVAVGRLKRFVALRTNNRYDNKLLSQQSDDNLAIDRHRVQRLIPREGIGTRGVC
jgi:hypothetical protein